MRLAACILVLTLAACGAPDAEEDRAASAPAATTGSDKSAAAESAAADEAPAPGVAVSLDGDGLRFVITDTGSSRPIAFGVDRAMVERAVGNAIPGEPKRESNAECPAGVMEFSRYDGLTLNFQDDKFVGWSIDDGSELATMDGIGIGTTRAQIGESREFLEQPGSALGDEVMIGGLSALLDGAGSTARITDLWAGTSCVFR